MPPIPSAPPATNGAKVDEEEEDEEDYMKMTFAPDTASTTSTTKKPTLTELRKRKLLHAETAGRPKSKAELEAEAKVKREEGLSISLLKEEGETNTGNMNKGLMMMKALGYKPGEALGRVEAVAEKKRILEPIQLSMKEDRSGIGRESEAKRKFREEAERKLEGEKKRKVDEGDFVERVRMEREEKRQEAMFVAAQKVAERLEEGDLDDETRRKRKLKSVPMLWRGLVKQREIEERDRRMRHDLYTSISTRQPEFDDPDLDNDDKIAMGKKADVVEVDDEDLDQDDEELEEFESLEPAEKLGKIVTFLREKWRYCFWCKYRYEDENMEGCPGLTEDEHG